LKKAKQEENTSVIVGWRWRVWKRAFSRGGAVWQ